MKKVVYMITTLFYPSIGGVENHVYNLSKELVKKGIKVKVINPIINLGENQVYNLNGIEIHKISIGNDKDQERYLNYKNKSKQNLIGFFNGYKRKYYYNKFAKFLYDYIIRDIELEKPDKFILHQHDFISSIQLSKKLAKKYNVMFTNHTGEFLFLKKLPMSNAIIKLLTNHFKYIIAPSDELAEFKGIRNNATYTFLSNGVDTEYFHPVDVNEKNELRNKHNIPRDKVVIICPRRWAPTKGVIYLVKAIDLLINKYKSENVVFVFAGNDYLDYPEYRNEILEIIKEKSLEKSIYLKGNVNSEVMNELVKLSDIVAIPSLMEAISLSALEGMACGKIILGTTVGGFPQIIRNNENGFLVEPKNEEKLSEVINLISDDLSNYSSICDNARKFVEVEYSWEFICDRTINIYNEFWN